MVCFEVSETKLLVGAIWPFLKDKQSIGYLKLRKRIPIKWNFLVKPKQMTKTKTFLKITSPRKKLGSDTQSLDNTVLPY